jgi:alpha-tubulin suppressor-like RCC1 family protein
MAQIRARTEERRELPVVYQPQAAWSCGYNGAGGLGDGTLTDRSLRVHPANMDDLSDIAAGMTHSLVATRWGSVFAWGDNYFGQVGDGTTNNQRLTPTAVNTLNRIYRVSANQDHSMALRDFDGTVWEWGRSLGGPNWGPVPVQVTGLTDMTAIAAGYGHGLALEPGGTVQAWGRNASGEVGNGTNVDQATPVQVSGLTDVSAIAAGTANSMALRSDGTVWAWGSNYDGQLGDGTMISRNVPVQVTGLPSAATAIATNSHHSLALLANGTVWAWGRNADGELGDGSTVYDRPTPGPVTGLTDVWGIAAGVQYSLARRSDGSLWGWGINVGGELGDGTTITRRTPVRALFLTGVERISAGMHTLVLAPLGQPQPPLPLIAQTAIAELLRRLRNWPRWPK